jgi:hypothetical protein
VLEARAAAAARLYRSDHPDADRMATGIAAWALMHGVATLWLNGNMPEALGDDPEAIARLVAHLDVSPWASPITRASPATTASARRLVPHVRKRANMLHI